MTTAQYVGMIGGMVAIGCALLLAAVVVMIARSEAITRNREEHPDEGSTGLPLEDLLPEEAFAVPMNADPVAMRAVLGETHCYGCQRPTSECGVLSTVTMRGAKLPSWLCGECEPMYRRFAADLSDMEIPASVRSVA